MKLNKCIKIIGDNYKIQKFTSSHYFFAPGPMYNATDFITLHIKEQGGRVVLTDCGLAREHSDLKECDVKTLCERYGFEYENGNVLKEFESLKDVENIIELIETIC